MNKTVKKITAILLLLCMVLSLCACGEQSITGITNFDVKDISDETFYCGVSVDDLSVSVNYTDDFEASDVNVVIDDPSIISIEFRTSTNWLFDTYIDYEITGLKEGSTSFYFETSDSIIKSDIVEVTVAQNIKSINFKDTSELTLYDWTVYEDKYFEIDSFEEIDDEQSLIEYVSENPEIATIEYEDSYSSYCCRIKYISPGETYVYLKTKDGTIRSEKIKVIAQASESEEPETPIEDEPVDNSRTVYVTPYGKKYHYSQSCAGSNASATTEDSVEGIYDPCKKCAQ